MEAIMQFIQQSLGALVTYAIVPLIFISIIVASHIAAFHPTRRGGPDIARIAGLAFGWLMLALVVVAKLTSNPALSVIPALGPLGIFVFVAVGFGIGYIFLWLVALATENNAAHFLIMVCNGGASISLYLYIFVEQVRDAFTYTAIAFLLGGLMYLMINKDGIKFTDLF